MKKMTSILALLLIIMLVGCSSVEKTIFQALNEDIEKQNGCNKDNVKLSELINNEATLYDKIIDLGTESFDEITPLIEEAKVIVSDSKSLLSSYEICIKDAASDTSKLKEASVKIKDTDNKNDTLILIEQYDLYADTLQKYVQALIALNEAQTEFYSKLTADIPMIELEQLVFNINEKIETTNKNSDEHKVAQERFNILYSEYYETYYSKK